MIKYILLVVVLFTTNVSADYQTGKEIFEKKCASCHQNFIEPSKLKENYFEEDNKLLNLTIPTTNMLVYAMLDSSKKIGDSSDKEMQKMEIETFLTDYLYEPDLDNSICDPNISKYYEVKKSMTDIVSEDEITELTDYFYDYKKERKKNAPKHNVVVVKDKSDIAKAIAKAKKENKLLMIEATAPDCWYCKKMHREVLSDEEVLTKMDKNYIFVEINVKEYKLPLGLDKDYSGMTPTFFAVTPDGKLLNKYRGAWEKMDFLLILKESL